MTQNDPAQSKSKSPGAPKANSDIDLVTRLAHLLQKTDLSEIELDKGDLHIRVARNLTVAPQVHHVAVAAPAAAPAHPVHALAAEPEIANPNAVPSPMVGTAYRRASPGAKAFVEVGAKVAAGEKILLIEAMKTFNDIVSPRAGTVTAIMIDDGQPVEYGQALMVVE